MIWWPVDDHCKLMAAKVETADDGEVRKMLTDFWQSIGHIAGTGRDRTVVVVDHTIKRKWELTMAIIKVKLQEFSQFVPNGIFATACVHKIEQDLGGIEGADELVENCWLINDTSPT
jgi:hypothetical protein